MKIIKFTNFLIQAVARKIQFLIDDLGITFVRCAEFQIVYKVSGKCYKRSFLSP